MTLKRAEAAPRAAQETPQEMIGALLGVIRRQFVPGATDQEWYRDHMPFVRRNVVLWPSAFVRGKGFTVSPERYKAVMFEIFQGVKRHGQTGEVRYWPGYLMRCVQTHWRTHWEEYYEEAKSIRLKAEMVLGGLRNLPTAARVDQVEVLARVFEATKHPHKVRRPKAIPRAQMELL